MSPGDVWGETWRGHRRVVASRYPDPATYELALGPRRAAALSDWPRRALCGALAGLRIRQMVVRPGRAFAAVARDLRAAIARLALPDYRALARLLPAALRPPPALALRGELPLLAPASLETAAGGGVTLRVEVPPALLPPNLSARHRALLRLVLEGHTRAAIGAALGSTAGAVEWHLTALYARMGARRRADLDPALLPLLTLAPSPARPVPQRHPLYCARGTRAGGPRGPRRCRLGPPPAPGPGGRVVRVDAGAYWA